MFAYPTGLLFLFLGLTFWSFLDKQGRSGKWAMWLAFAGLGFYAFNLFASAAGIEHKLWAIFRDLILTALLTKVVVMIKSKPKLLFVVGAIVVFYHFFYKNKVHQQLMSFDLEQSAEANGDWELLVDLKNNKDITILKNLETNFDVSYKRAFEPLETAFTELDDYYLLNVPNEELTFEKVKRYLQKHSALIDGFEDNEVVKITPIPINKSLKLNKNYGINDPGIKQVWGFDKMKVGDLYQMLTKVKPSKKARIAILDTGVDAEHEDLKERFFSINKKYNKDRQAHGTHCAGIAAAVTNNGKGIASFAPNNDFVEITSVKVLNDFGVGTQQKIINGMITAADTGVDVISMSLGGRSDDMKKRAYIEAVKYCNKKGAIVVVAAGNDGANAKHITPANTPGVITVSAVDSDLNKAVFSNTVADLNWGVAAPGVDIYSTIPNNKYASFNGTSMATPYVAGLVALMRAVQPDLDTETVYDILNKTGTETGNTTSTGMFIQPKEAIKVLLD